MAELVLHYDGDGRLVGQSVTADGVLGEEVGGVRELGRTLGVDPYVLRMAIANGNVPASFEGQGRYRIGGDVMRRGVDASGHLRPEEGEV